MQKICLSTLIGKIKQIYLIGKKNMEKQKYKKRYVINQFDSNDKIIENGISIFTDEINNIRIQQFRNDGGESIIFIKYGTLQKIIDTLKDITTNQNVSEWIKNE